MTGARSGAPDPERAGGAPEFVAALQALKDWSGLTYRELSSRAETIGDVLPRSTVANMLGRGTVPREELVAAFVRACGCDPGELDTWLRVRKELARGERQAGESPDVTSAAAGAAGEAPDAVTPAAGRAVGGPAAPAAHAPAPASPAPASASAPGSPVHRSRRRTWGVPAVAGVLIVAAAVAAAVTLVGGEGSDGSGGGRTERSAPLPVASGPGPAPAPGAVSIRAVHSGLCLAEDGGQNGQLFQRTCAPDSIPRFSLERIDGGWLLVTFHQRFGEGCTGVRDRSAAAGAPVEDQECGKRGPAEAFRLEPVGSPVRGYRLRPLHSDLCVGVADGTTRAGEPVRQLECAGDMKGQLFAFDRRTPAAAG
ncbi:RICIN domain-containing protein [Streptomyces sp. NPDC018833]|uniref:RICIN domain-containing protein n=1 Tax=Streptomyces sp. NPDC018833 TaxID=3365053 RepID=UPI00378B43D2